MEETKIFISYAHKDDAYFRVFREGIDNHSKSSKKVKWEIWSDKEIQPGSLWHNEIQSEIKNCDAAILLVSANFLSSDYIENEEFLHFLKRNEENGFIFLPILLSDCDFTQWENLSSRQFFYPQGVDYGLSRLKNIAYSHLVEFNRELVPLPNPYRETYHKKCVEAFEKAILSKQNKPKKPVPIDNSPDLATVLSNKDILNALNLFQEQIKVRELNEKELADAMDTKIKLYKAIFGDFDNLLKTTNKNNLASVIFDRIFYASELIQDPDIDTIQKFRNNKVYEDIDRCLIVSGLTIGLLKNFDPQKIHLLIDFLTDFEEEVWQRALVGLVFALTSYTNRLSLYPEIENRLNELKEISSVQKSLFLIDTILRNRTFSIKETLKKNPNLLFSKLKIFFGNSIELSRQDLSEIQYYLHESSDSSIENKMLNSLINNDTIEKLSYELEKVETTTLTIEEFFNVFNYDTYFSMYELNPFQFNLTDELFKSSHNWFIPFKDNAKIRNILVNNFPVKDIDVLDFIKKLEKSNLSDIDKHYLLTHIKEFSKEFIYMIYVAFILEGSLTKSMSTLEIVITKALRDLYRFYKLSETTQNDNVFDGELSIYGQSLLQKVANNITEFKINSKNNYDNEKYVESLKYLQKIPDNKYDLDVLELYINNYFALKQDEKAIPYLNELFGLFANEKTEIIEIAKVYWHTEATRLYKRLQEKDPEKYRKIYRDYLSKEISLREKIFNESLVNELDISKEENGDDLANNYFDETVNYWIFDKNIIEAFFSLFKYFNVLIQIHNENNNADLQKKLELRKNDIIVLFQLILKNEEFDIIQILNERGGDVHKSLYYKTNRLVSIFHKFKDIEPIFKVLKQNHSIQNHAKYLYDIILPVIKDVKEEHKGKYENIMVPFTLEKLNFEILFSINDFLEEGINIIIEKLSSSEIIIDKLYAEYIDLFLFNLFIDKKLQRFSKKVIVDNIASNFIKIHLPGKNKESEDSIDTIRNLINQGQYEDALSLLNKYLKTNPQNHIAWNLKGNCMFFLERPNEEIIGCYNKAIEFDKEFYVALENRANIFIKMDRFQEALKDCEDALKINPESDIAKKLKKEALEGIGM